MKLVSVTSTLLTVALFACLLGCYSTIPATDIEPVFSPCGIASEVYKTSGYHYGSTAGKERVVVGGKTVDVYFIDSVAYSYDNRGRLVREQKVSTGGRTDETFSYSPGLLVRRWISYDKLGVERQVSPRTAVLNDRGYEVLGSGYTYDNDGRRIRQPGILYDYDRWVNGSRVYLYHAGEDYVNKIESSFDLAHLSLPNPHQFEGLGNKSLLLLDIYTIFNTYEHVWQRVYHADSYYLFDVQGRVSRKITVYASYGEGDLPLAGGQPNYTDVTDYEYVCP